MPTDTGHGRMQARGRLQPATQARRRLVPGGTRATLASVSFLAFGGALTGGAQAQTAPANEYDYVAKEGDTLGALALQYLVRQRSWQDLLTHNSARVQDPRRIPIGTHIYIPYDWLRDKGHATVLKAVEAFDGNSRPLKAGDELDPGALVETRDDGSLTLSLPDGSTITLQKSTSLSIDALQQVGGDSGARDIRLNLKRGRTETHVEKQGDQSRFQIQTPVAVSAVRGTRFRSVYEPEAGRALDETTEGTVLVTGQAGQGVPVGAGFGTLVTPNAAPLPPVQLLPPPDLTAIPAVSTGGALALNWPAVTGAVRYRVQLAPDPDFQTILSDTETPAPAATVPAPPLGAYYLRVHSIDTLGLEGLDAVRTLTQRAAIPAPRSPQPGVQVAGTQTPFSWSGDTTGAHYRWQLSRDGSFDNPLMQRDVADATGLTIDALPPGSYQWRVATLDANGQPGEWSAASEFRQGGLPVPVAAHERGIAVLLRWEGAAGTRYHVQVARDAGFTHIVADTTVDSPRLSIPKLTMGGYYARVAPVGPSGDTFGEARHFRVGPPVWLQLLVPAAVILVIVLT